jgi:hypothetical protein
MSGPKRNPDKLNTIGVVVVGICGAVLVYVTIVALQAFYMNDTSDIQTMADYGGQDTTAKTHKAAEMSNITDYGRNAAGSGTPTFHVPIDQAMKGVVESAKTDPAHLIPALPPQTKPTIEPVFGRPKPLAPPAPPAAPAAGSGSGSGSAAQTGTTAAPMAPTGAAPEPQPVAGAGGQVTTPKKEPAKPAQPPVKSPTPPPAAPKGSNGK